MSDGKNKIEDSFQIKEGKEKRCGHMPGPTGSRPNINIKGIRPQSNNEINIKLNITTTIIDERKNK